RRRALHDFSRYCSDVIRPRVVCLNYGHFFRATHLRYAVCLQVMSNPVLHVENLTKRYGDVEAVRGISFEVNEGEVFGLLGPNGAGKTSTVEILEGLRNADSGTVSVC